MIEIKANVTFGQYQAGKHYQVDPQHSGVQAFIRSGYFQVTEAGGDVAEVSDSGSLDPVPDSGVEKRKPGRPKKKVEDGTGGDLRTEGDPVHSGGNTEAGSQDS